MNSALSTFRRVLVSVALATIFCTDCNNGEDCTTGKAYYGSVPPAEGTVSYGQPPVSQPFGGSPGPSVYQCMQAPDACASVSFGSDSGAFPIEVTVAPLQNGQVITLPSPDVTVTASLNDAYAGIPYDGGAAREALTLVSGTITVTVSLNNFDAHFDMTFTRPDGEPVVIQNGRMAMLNATWTETTTCY
ncbi:MAG: hypothetical protein WBP56_22730 [Polyangia bacterium]